MFSKISLCFTIVIAVTFAQLKSNAALPDKKIECKLTENICQNIVSSSTYSNGCNNCYCQEGTNFGICTAMACLSMESETAEDKKFCDIVRKKTLRTRVVYKSCQDPKTTCANRADGDIFTDICQRCTCKGEGNEPQCESTRFRFGKKCKTYKSTYKAKQRFCQNGPKFESKPSE